MDVENILKEKKKKKKVGVLECISIVTKRSEMIIESGVIMGGGGGIGFILLVLAFKVINGAVPFCQLNMNRTTVKSEVDFVCLVSCNSSFLSVHSS